MKQKNTNRKNKSFWKGFTLLELTVVIAASMILLALSWESLSKSRQDANESAACNELASYINKTRTYALTGKTDKDGKVPDKFYVTTSRSNNVTSIYIKADGTLVEKYDIKGGIDCDSVNLNYSVPGGGISGTNNYNCGTLHKYHVDVDKFKAVCNSN
ncbi:MAG: hypothetical protein HGB08_04675 [Candidatus Moranbacteria bacterium]|nr:hypothetical protein [Candidatus Moranbacteria bacterium]